MISAHSIRTHKRIGAAGWKLATDAHNLDLHDRKSIHSWYRNTQVLGSDNRTAQQSWRQARGIDGDARRGHTRHQRWGLLGSSTDRHVSAGPRQLKTCSWTGWPWWSPGGRWQPGQRQWRGRPRRSTANNDRNTKMVRPTLRYVNKGH